MDELKDNNIPTSHVFYRDIDYKNYYTQFFKQLYQLWRNADDYVGFPSHIATDEWQKFSKFLEECNILQFFEVNQTRYGYTYQIIDRYKNILFVTLRQLKRKYDLVERSVKLIEQGNKLYNKIHLYTENKIKPKPKSIYLSNDFFKFK